MENIYLIDSTYKIINGRLYVELFGKNAFGASVTALVEGFFPYFHIIEPNEYVTEKLDKDINVIDYQPCKLYHKGENKDAVTVWIKHPFMVPAYRAKFDTFDTVSCDIMFHRRFLFDNDFGAFLSIDGRETGNEKYTTDKVMVANRITNCEPFDVVGLFKILSFDLENSIETGRIFCLCCYTDDGTEKSFYGTELEIIDAFVNFVREYDPDIITGYNIENYDFNVLIKRLEKMGKDISHLKINRDKNTAMRMRSEKFAEVTGRAVVDAWRFVKKYKSPKRETLKYVSKKFLGKEKLDVDTKKLDGLWETDRERVLEYCLQDARLPLFLIKEIGVLKRSVELSIVSKLDFDDIIMDMNSVLIDSLLIREMDRSFVAVPRNKYREKDSKIKGGYVRPVKPGLHDLVIVGDFRSLYPSLIIENNVCITTLSDDGENVSPVGARFVSKERKVGILPRLLKDLVDRRQRVKKKIKETTDEKEKEYLEGLSDAIKILSNANYGVFASSFYRFTNKEIGESITAYARQSVHEVEDDLAKKGLEVILADTDSCYFLSPHDTLEDTVKLGKDIEKEFSMGNKIFEFEKVFNPLFAHGKKKRYVGKVVWPPENKKIEIKGYENRRTDSFDLQSRTLESVFKMIMDRNVDAAVKIATKVLKDIEKGRLPNNDYVISRSVKSEKEYTRPNSMANVQARRKLKELGVSIPDGMKVSYIVVDGKKTPQEVEPYIDGNSNHLIPDKDYYYKRMARTLVSVLEPFEITLNALQGQKKLMDF